MTATSSPLGRLFYCCAYTIILYFIIIRRRLHTRPHTCKFPIFILILRYFISITIAVGVGHRDDFRKHTAGYVLAGPRLLGFLNIFIYFDILCYPIATDGSAPKQSSDTVCIHPRYDCGKRPIIDFENYSRTIKHFCTAVVHNIVDSMTMSSIMKKKKLFNILQTYYCIQFNCFSANCTK